MAQKELFKRFHTRLVWEGILKSALCGLIIGFAVNIAAALICWLVGMDGGFLLAIAIWFGVSVISGVILYFVRFRPTVKDIARKVDKLRLDERVITMLELENDQSYIAMRQREDARERLKAVNAKQLKFHFSTAMVVLVIVFALGGTSMTTFAGLAENGKGPISPFDPDNPENYIAVTYIVDEGGSIEGETDQLVKPGEAATPVTAVADDGWAFVEWDDGVTNPSRTDENVTEEIFVTAIFEQLEEGDGGEPGDGEPGDTPEDMPSEETEGKPGEPGEPAEPGDPSDGMGGRFEESNQIIDGETFFRDYLDYYYNQVKDGVLSDEGIPSVIRDLLERYYGSL